MAADEQTVAANVSLEDEIQNLEARLNEARARLKSIHLSDEADAKAPSELAPSPPSASLGPPTHFLLLLSDSALPLGSFAFSSGLESYLAHNAKNTAQSQRPTFSAFLPSSLSSFASSTLPFVLAAHRDPSAIADLDDQLDAAIICTVGRRASVAQGRALLGIWERSFRQAFAGEDDDARRALRAFSALLREGQGGAAAQPWDIPPLVSAHLAPLFGAICAVAGLSLRQTAYVFVLSHVKALVSAAVRASMFGPYQAQKVMASENVQRMVDAVIDREWDTPVEEAGQSVPAIDLWIGRHEILYSRIFNS